MPAPRTEPGRSSLPRLSCRSCAADYVVDVTNYWGENVDENLLEWLGFEPVIIASLDPECYQVWRRKRAGSGPIGNRTALK